MRRRCLFSSNICHDAETCSLTTPPVCSGLLLCRAFTFRNALDSAKVNGCGVLEFSMSRTVASLHRKGETFAGHGKHSHSLLLPAANGHRWVSHGVYCMMLFAIEHALMIQGRWLVDVHKTRYKSPSHTSAMVFGSL